MAQRWVLVVDDDTRILLWLPKLFSRRMTDREWEPGPLMEHGPLMWSAAG